MKKHSCTKVKEAHPVKRLATRAEVVEKTGREPERLMTGHALCGECYEPVSVCKLGKYHHV